jgi:hypothetical protein
MVMMNNTMKTTISSFILFTRKTLVSIDLKVGEVLEFIPRSKLGWSAV